jgi:hypothetical protein
VPGDDYSPGIVRFDELGRYQFELLCRELAGRAAEWRDDRVAIVTDNPRFSEIEAPVFLIAAWHGKESVDSVVRNVLEEWRPRQSVVVLTNAEVDSLEADVKVVDAGALSQVVESDPALRLRMPSLLGVCDDAIFDAEVVQRSSADVAAARELARIFVPTRAYRAAVGVLGRHRFAVLTGPPEMGKTASARMVGLARLSGGWEFHECIRPEELWTAYARDREQVFVADDAFGSTEYRPDAAERWAVELDRILRAMDDRHWLVWTSRPAPLKAGLGRIHREHGVERFPKPAAVEVDAASLDVAEKAMILFRHARAAGLPRSVLNAVRLHGWEIVSHEYFTPERIRRFVHLHAVRTAPSAADLVLLVDAAIREPTAAMSASFHGLEPSQRAALVALLDSQAGHVSERELAAAVRRHFGMAIGQRPDQLIDRLTDHFVRVGDGGVVTWVHPSWRDLVIDELSADRALRQQFIASSSLDGLLLALSVAGGPEGERVLPLLPADEDWDHLCDRLSQLIPDLDEPSTKRLLVAFAEALDAVEKGRRRELEATIEETLRLLVRKWTRERATPPVGLVRDWLALRSRVREQPPLPDLAAAWFEVVPATGGARAVTAAELADFGEWVGLVELLHEQAPELLRAFGYPASVVGALESFAARIERSGPFDDATAVGSLVRLANVCEPLALRLREAARVIHSDRREYEPVEMYTPRQLSPELVELLDAPAPSVVRGPAIVRRVLRDL